MTDREFEEYKRNKEIQENYEKMKRDGQLFYIEVKPIKYNRDICEGCPNRKPGQYTLCNCTLPYINQSI